MKFIIANTMSMKQNPMILDLIRVQTKEEMSELKEVSIITLQSTALEMVAQ